MWEQRHLCEDFTSFYKQNTATYTGILMILVFRHMVIGYSLYDKLKAGQNTFLAVFNLFCSF